MTAQSDEFLIIDGTESAMAFCPPMPLGDSRVIENEEYPKNSGCLRGYIATWEVKKGKFFLVDIEGKYNLKEDKPILANWFTGVLKIPEGKLVKYVHMGFESIHEKEKRIEIVEGVVVNEQIVDTSENEVSEDLKRGISVGMQLSFIDDPECRFASKYDPLFARCFDP